MIKMEQTWRWYGPDDPVPLSHIKMAGATGIVTALHHISNGEAWSEEDILKRKEMIEKADLRWSVVESVPVHDDIKTRQGNCEAYIENYKTTLRNLGNCGIKTVCYNFMPVLDWTRTDLKVKFRDGSLALGFNLNDVAVFDIFILKRNNAEDDYTENFRKELNTYYKQLSSDKLSIIKDNILKGLPGSEASYSLDDFRSAINRYKDIGRKELKENLFAFIREVAPVAEESEVKLAIHPDDPPRSLFGLPRVVSREEDLRDLLFAVDSPSNGFTLCTGSYGVEPSNDLPGMVERYGSKLHFIHLRNIERDEAGNFLESNHLEGVVDMHPVVFNILKEINRRGASIPMRPDHGHQMLDDLEKEAYPGYTAIGRLRGLAELRGLEEGIVRSWMS